MKTKPQFISLLLPVSNAQATLKDTLDSLFSQTYPHFEVIAIDDNSKDDSYKILREYKKRDKRLIISRNVKRYGLSVTLNRALREARGQFLGFVNQADIITSDKLKRQLFYLNRHPKVAGVGTQVVTVDPESKTQIKSDLPTDHETISKTFLTQNSLHLESVLINRYLLPMDLLKFEAQEYAVIYRTLLAKLLPYGQFANLNQHLYIKTLIQGSDFETVSKKAVAHAKLWLRARFVYKSEISIQSLLHPINNKIRPSA